MKDLYKGLLITLVAASACVAGAPPNASAQIITTDYTTLPSVVDYSTLSNPVILSEPAVIDTTPVLVPRLMTAPVIINTRPMFWRGCGHRRHFFHLGDWD